MYEVEARFVKETRNYKVYELMVDDQIIPVKLYFHKELFEPGNELAQDQEVRIKLTDAN